MNGATIFVLTFVLWAVGKGRFGQYVTLATTSAATPADTGTAAKQPASLDVPAVPTLPSIKYS